MFPTVDHFGSVSLSGLFGTGVVPPPLTSTSAIPPSPHGPTAIIQAVPLRRRATGVCEITGPVVRRNLRAAQPEAIEAPQYPQVAVEIEKVIADQYPEYLNEINRDALPA